jgi:hypothetical protein
MNRLVIYIHGKGGNAKEAEHYKPLFPKDDVIISLKIRGKPRWNFQIFMKRQQKGMLLLLWLQIVLEPILQCLH